MAGSEYYDSNDLYEAHMKEQAEAEAKEAWESYVDEMNDWLDFPDEQCPRHYDKTIQPWAYMESVMSEEAFVGYLQGNVIKYISRWKEKGGREDLRKAKHYLEKMLEVV